MLSLGYGKEKIKYDLKWMCNGDSNIYVIVYEYIIMVFWIN